MPRKDIEFKSGDNLTLRGWLYTPSTPAGTEKLPCIILCHGFASLKEFALDDISEKFVANLPIATLVYDHRSFGASDSAPGQPRNEIIPSLQMSDLQDAITYAQSLEEIDPSKIGIWGSSYSGGEVLQVAATDKRVKAVISQAPVVDAATAFGRLVKPDVMAAMSGMFQGDRLARAAGQPAATLAVTSLDPSVPAALTSEEAYNFYTGHAAKVGDIWKNEVTIRSVEYGRAFNPSHMIERISPSPLLLVVAKHDYAGPTDLALSAFNRALEPKKLVLVDCMHFEMYSGANFDFNIGSQIEFLRDTLCK